MNAKIVAVCGVMTGILALQGGCLVTSAEREEESGVAVSGSTLEQVAPGETTEAWLLATLGEPTSRQPVAGKDGVEILRYDHCQTKASSGTVLFLFGGSSASSTTQRTYFEVTNGVVTRHWREE